MNRKNLQWIILFACAFLQGINGAEAQWMKQGAGPGFNVFSMRVMGADLYAGGTGVAKWNGTAWTNMGRVAPTTTFGLGYLGINSMVVFRGELYAGGDIDSLGGVYLDHTIGVGKWNGTAWEKLGTSPKDLAGVKHMIVYHDALYACGTGGINKWDGTAWTNIATNSATCMAVYHDDLYIGGNFSSMGGAAMTVGLGFAKYDGSTFTALTGFYDTLSVLPGINAASIASMIVFKDELYAVGALDYAGSLFTRGAAKWNGTTWNTTNGGMTGNGSFMVNCMSTDSNNLYVVGPIQKVNTTNDSIYLSTSWDGGKWHPMFGGDAAYTSFVTTINYNGDIYTAYNGFAKWTGAKTAIPMLNQVYHELAAYPNPTNGLLHVTLPEGATTITITNTLGATVYSRQVDHSSADQVIDISDMPDGMYFVTTRGATGVATAKILLQR